MEKRDSAILPADKDLTRADSSYSVDTVLGDLADDTTDSTIESRGDETVDENISDPVEPEKRSTRRVLRTEIIPDNRDDQTALVTVAMMAQTRSRGAAACGEPWVDADHFDLRSLGAGQQVRIALGPNQTKKLFLTLIGRYKGAGTYEQIMSEIGSTVIDGDDVTILKGRERQVIEKLLSEGGEGVLDHIEALQPDLVETVALKKQQERREAAVQEFEQHLTAGDWNENQWQEFFERHTWIFGHNLLFQFVSKLSDQAHLGGTTFRGTGPQRTDTLLTTEASARFTVLVDIKRPDSQLVGDEQYRNRVYPLGKDLTGGVSQLQSYHRTWVVDSSRQEDTAAELLEEGISTYEPRGILVIGNLNQLDHAHKRSTFELFRRNLHNPEVITYDELLTRAKFTVRLEAEAQE